MSVSAADRVTGQWAGSGEETPVTNPQTPSTGFCTIYGKQGTRRLAVDLQTGKGSNQPPHPIHPRVPLWRCEVFDSQVYRKLSVVLAGVAVLTLAGCSNKASNEAAAAAKKPGAAKLAAAAKAPQPTAMVTVPKGTAISATVGQTLATNKNKV